MEKVLSKEESYVERRKLFKNIWETAMHMDDKEADIINKPKVIKTLRLDEMSRVNVGKTKKQRIKNLRNVCNRLLDFCDRQEANDVIFEQLATEGIVNPPRKPGETKTRKSKTVRHKKNVNKVKSYSPTVDHPPAALAASEARDLQTQELHKTPNPSSPNQVKRTTIVKKAVLGGKNLNPKTSPFGEPGDITSHRKFKKKASKRKSPKGHAAGKAKIGR